MKIYLANTLASSEARILGHFYGLGRSPKGFLQVELSASFLQYIMNITTFLLALTGS
ncbi:MAG TPA: hypothetical protein VFP20_07730 [Bacteroidales bacterium]|nr:hypothetical protein [Bacteroidales bacterium]